MSIYDPTTEKTDPIASTSNGDLQTTAATLRELADIIEQVAYTDAVDDGDVTDLLDAAHQQLEVRR